VRAGVDREVANLWLLRLPSTAEKALRAEAARYGTAVASRLLFLVFYEALLVLIRDMDERVGFKYS
jgi:hypothetical protein